jgi:serine/threonine protein kinase
MLAAGSRLGPYEILTPLGAGGMGEVYKARDTRLDRTVAIKVLPAEVASDPELRARFEREARAIAALDVKSANIFLVRSGGASAPPVAKLLDFGLAKLRGPAAPISMSGMTRLATSTPNTAHGTILGTVHYMSPEQVEVHEADARSDIWVLGAVIYEMATGARPFDGESTTRSPATRSGF